MIRLQKYGIAGLAISLLSNLTAGAAPFSLQDLQTRYNTYLGSVVVVVENGKKTAYQYNGELYGQLLKVPEAQREMAKTQILAQSGLSEADAKEVVVLLPIGGRQPVFKHRDVAYRFEDALELYPDEDLAASLNIPASMLRKRLVGAREVPWEVTQTPEYKAQLAQRKAQEAAFLAATLMIWREQAGAAAELPDCAHMRPDSEGRMRLVPC